MNRAELKAHCFGIFWQEAKKILFFVRVSFAREFLPFFLIYYTDCHYCIILYISLFYGYDGCKMWIFGILRYFFIHSVFFIVSNTEQVYGILYFIPTREIILIDCCLYVRQVQTFLGQDVIRE